MQASQPVQTGNGQPPSQQEVLDSIACSGDEFSIDGQLANQVLLDLQAESTSTLPDTWVTNMTASPLIPQLQTMLRLSPGPILVMHVHMANPPSEDSCNSQKCLFYSCVPAEKQVSSLL